MPRLDFRTAPPRLAGAALRRIRTDLIRLQGGRVRARRRQKDILGDCPTDMTEWLQSLWWVVFGATLLVTRGLFAANPYTYQWMSPLPQWGWGAVILAVGLWQRGALLWVGTWPARFWAALGGDILALVLLLGFATAGHRSASPGFYALQALTSTVCLLRLYSRRKG